MNDTKSTIWQIFSTNFEESFQSSDIFEKLEGVSSLVTIKRHLADLVSQGVIIVSGSGRSTSYQISDWGRLHAPIDSTEYFKKDERDRGGKSLYNFDIMEHLCRVPLFFESELFTMQKQTKKYQDRVKELTPTLHKKELERFIIELSWKSSKIEGNTYTLLDTEKLLREGVFAEGHKPEEAIMILNHKKAFDFALELSRRDRFSITPDQVLDLHSLLVSDLGVSTGLRSGPVGITGSTYVPMSIPAVISEQFELLITSTNSIQDYYTKALVILLGISYLQPFEDGNKRTARLLANAFLLMGSCAPLSYRNVDEAHYRNSLLVFYEQNSIEPFKKIFIEQYAFSCEYYNIG
jgi:hypothetical protein